MDPLFTIHLAPDRRLAVNLFEVMGVEEAEDSTEETTDADGNKVKVLDTRRKPKRVLRIYLRNGAAFTIPDANKELFDKIQDHLRGYGGNTEPAHAQD